MTSSNSDLDNASDPCHGDGLDSACSAIPKGNYGFYAASAEARENRLALEKDPSCISETIRNKALQMGADLVGICDIDKRWLYKTDSLLKYGTTVDFLTVIVVVIAMDAESFRTSPSPAIPKETMRGYRCMNDVAVKLGRHIASLGYNALSTGNGTSVSIPPAIEAGLGKLGRNGLLINERLGPCLRICKIFTDMPLKAHGSKRSLLAEICQNCTICAAECPAEAIEGGQTPARDVWRIDKALCATHRKKTNRECAACISECPATWRNRLV